jgi:hypothetical protein
MKIILDPNDIVRQALQAPAVREGLRDRRDIVLARARREAFAAGATEFAESLHAESGTRPGTKSPTGIKRPFERVIADSDDASDREHGNRGVPKQAILRRAMRR